MVNSKKQVFISSDKTGIVTFSRAPNFLLSLIYWAKALRKTFLNRRFRLITRTFFYANKVTTKSIFSFTSFFSVAPTHSHTTRMGCDRRNMSVNFSFLSCSSRFRQISFLKSDTIINSNKLMSNGEIVLTSSHSLRFQHIFYTYLKDLIVHGPELYIHSSFSGKKKIKLWEKKVFRPTTLDNLNYFYIHNQTFTLNRVSMKT